MSQAFELLATIRFAIRVCRYVLYPKVYTQPILRLDEGGLLNVHGDKQVPFTALEYEITLASATFQCLTETSSADKRNVLPPGDCPDRNRVFVKTEDAIIVGYSSE